ncbi:winged helix-turn-helix domain-containing protein [Mesorhizobium kowhaii]
MWIPDLSNSVGPRYKAIIDALERAIASKCLYPGDRLPTHRELAERLGVSVQTVARAYARRNAKDYSRAKLAEERLFNISSRNSVRGISLIAKCQTHGTSQTSCRCSPKSILRHSGRRWSSQPKTAPSSASSSVDQPRA